MSFFKEVVYLLIAAGAANADPIGPNAAPSAVTPYEWDEVKGWWDATFTSGDSSAYTQISEDNKASIAKTLSPGITDTGYGESMFWTSADLASGDLWIRHSKNGLYSDWVAVTP